MYNLFHPTNPVACRLEPLLCPRFALLTPANVCRYHKYPLGDGQPVHLCKWSRRRGCKAGGMCMLLRQGKWWVLVVLGMPCAVEDRWVCSGFWKLYLITIVLLTLC